MSDAVRYTRPLAGVRMADAGQVGGKAAALGELLEAGFRVPAGFVVLAPEQAAGRDGDAGAPLPHGLVTELEHALADLGDGPVAVRSSAADEDGDQLSFAGQYESLLNIRGTGAVIDAVRRCRASGGSDRVTVYRGDRHAARPIPVLVQRMVPADVAGVAFSANPVTGDRNEKLVSAVAGLADRLMSGEVTPEDWVMRDGSARLRSGGRDVLREAQVRAIAELTERVAAHFGMPQDVEWAIADGIVWLVQARPVTALPGLPPPEVPLAIDVPPGFWTRGPGSERPWVPLQRSVYLPVLSDHLGGILAFSVLGPPQVREIGGWVYVKMDDTGDQAVLAARAERIAAAAGAGEPGALVRRWQTEWKPAFAKRIGDLRDTDLPALPDRGLVSHARAVTELFTGLHAVYFQLAGASSFIVGQLGLACQELLGWSPQQTFDLRRGLRGDHVAAVAALADLAVMAARHPAVRSALDRADSVTVTHLRELDPAFAAAFSGYLRAYAHRTNGFDLTEPTLAEQPHLLLNLVRAQMHEPYDVDAERARLDERVAAAAARARAMLADRNEDERGRFETALAASHASTEVRDEKVFYAVSAWALLRDAALETGSRLARNSQLTQAGDVFFLEWDEALDALGTGTRLSDRVWRRRGELAWANSHPGPPRYGEPAGGGPALEGLLASLAPAVRRAAEASLWTTRLWGSAPQPGGDGDRVLRGTAASAGQYTGSVRIITGMHEFSKLRRGDVLVCPETTAQWAVLFPSIGALVCDHGGLLSHPAIIAREYGVPAVVATRTATSVLRDDQIVTVDGTAGTVRPV
jgi:rifampicin phosphotransferase